MRCRAGDIVLLPFPFSEHPVRKKRPILVLIKPDRRGDFPALAITSVPTHNKAHAISSEHLSEGALPKPSWVRFDILRLVPPKGPVVVFRPCRLSD